MTLQSPRHSPHTVLGSFIDNTTISEHSLLILDSSISSSNICSFRSFILFPVIWRILIPVVDLFFQRLRSAVHNARFVTLAQLEVLGVFSRNGVVRLLLAAALEHPSVIPRAESEPEQTAHDVCDNVVHVKVAIVGQEALQEFGTNAQDQGAYYKRHIYRSAAIRVDDPVEDDCEKEEREEVEELVVDEMAELEFR